MNKISCNTCLDLMPLVKDGVASEESKKLVEEHIEVCSECRSIYNNTKEIEVGDFKIDNDKVLGKIKKKLYSLAGLILILGSMAGVNMGDSENIFYNMLIMPVLGMVAYLAFEKKAYVASALVFIITFIYRMLFGYLKEYHLGIKMLFTDSLTTSMIFVVFFFVGIIILKLLSISIYGKGGK